MDNKKERVGAKNMNILGDARCQDYPDADWQCAKKHGGNTKWFCNEETGRCEREPCEIWGNECEEENGPGWICRGGKCVFECTENSDCWAEKGSERWRCNTGTGECYPQDCTGDADCEEWYGEGYTCDPQGNCGRSLCSGWKDPDLMCRKWFNENWRCGDDGYCEKKPCQGPEDCKRDELCIDGKCKKMPCEGPLDCGIGRVCVEGHCRNVDCIKDTDCEPWENCEGCRCVDRKCEIETDCRKGQACKNGKCVVVECIGDEDCGTDKRCVNNECIRADECIDKNDCPDSLPICLHGRCIECEKYRDCPGSEICINHVCVNVECEEGETRLGTCEECRDYIWQTILCGDDPDCPAGCVCIGGECNRACIDKSDCKRGYRCRDGHCVRKECSKSPDCNPGQWCDDGLCRPLTGGVCESWQDCADGYFCGETGCEKSPCNDYTDCPKGLCCCQGECIACEDTTCYVQAQCPPGWFCDRVINKCRPRDCDRHSDCEEGYHCDLEFGKCVPLPTEEINMEDEEVLSAHPCRVGHDDDCRGGQVCIGYPVHILKRILSPGTANGYCGEPDELLIRITGIDDEKTCDYCRALIGNMWPQSKVPLPPYHEHCRCDYEFV